MKQKIFTATAWNNGEWAETGAGYGLKVEIADRDRFFDKCWKKISLNLVAGEKHRMATVNIDKSSNSSFWTNCPELRSKDIGQWFIENNFVDCQRKQWTKGKGCPQRFQVALTGKRKFEVRPYSPE